MALSAEGDGRFGRAKGVGDRNHTRSLDRDPVSVTEIEKRSSRLVSATSADGSCACQVMSNTPSSSTEALTSPGRGLCQMRH